MKILDDLERLGEDEKKTPLERGQASEGLGHCREGVVVVFLTLDQLRLYGPVALREWLKRTRRAPRATGEIVLWHQEAAGREE